MSAYTYTLVVKGVSSPETDEKILQMVAEKVCYGHSRDAYDVIIVKRLGVCQDELLVRLWIREDHPRYGRNLAAWLGELPHAPPFPDGTLLWYA